jgi:hypothetical protein
MSQDLFAAFGGEPSEPAKSTPADVEGDDDDDFGDFEDASASAVSQVQPKPSHGTELDTSIPSKLANEQNLERLSFPPKSIEKSGPLRPESNRTNAGSHPFAGHMDLLFEAGDEEYDAGTDELADLSTNPEAAMAFSKRIIAEQEAAQAKKESLKSSTSKLVPRKAPAKKMMSNHTRNTSNPDSGPKKLRKKSGYVPAQEPEVLFDAENVSDHESGFDEFGDFDAHTNDRDTGVSPIARVERAKAMPIIPSVDLLGLDDQPAIPPSTNGALSDNKARNSSSRQTMSLPQAAELDDDGWDDFETAAPASPPSSSDQPNDTRSSSSIQAQSNTTNTLPPTNIPPPSILLSLFPSLFSSADEALFSAMARLDLKQRQILLAHPASHQFLKGYLSHCVVLAHIIAGRKLRWKRDQHLSQSMRIGPSAAGGKSGMKLAGVDKAELAKEEREVLDTIDLWKAQVGKLRTAVTTASAAPGLPKLPSVPEIAESMPVRTLKPSEGGISATHACALCGLRREERVAKVDLEVEDSFGEWWVQGMNMHVGCRRFWEEFEKKLKSR